MYCKNLFYIIIALLPWIGTAQHKIFSYDKVQSRNERQEWGNVQKIFTQTVEFTGGKINLKIDKNYKLTLVSKTNLPDNGIIYLCTDEKSNPLTVKLIDDLKMYLDAKTRSSSINFMSQVSLFQLAEMD